MENHGSYYIGTGATGALYTLRAVYEDYNWQGRIVEKDSYIKTLSADLDDSIERARAYLGDNVNLLDISTAPELRTITRSTIDHSIIRFGKYQDHTVSEVANLDREYLIWAAMNMISKTHEKTIELIKAEVATEIEAAKEADRLAVEREQEDERNEEARIAKLSYVGTVGERTDLTLTYTGDHTFEGIYGMTTLYFFQDDNGNELVWKTSSFLRNPGSDDCTDPIRRGSKLTIKATIKTHGEYNDKKQTELTRVKVVM